jgi:hypothetical protein
MNCNLNAVNAWVWVAIGFLLAALAFSFFWVAALPLYIAAALVLTVSLVFIPQIKNALLAYAECRGPSDKCTISQGVNTLGQAAAALSAVAFLVAAVLETSALAFIYSWILSWLAWPLQSAVNFFVHSGQLTCVVVIVLLVGVLSNAYGYKSCMDNQGAGSGGGGVV